MKTVLLLISIMLCVTLIFPILDAEPWIRNSALHAMTPEGFTIEGLVERNLNLTYAELKNLPLVSEVATLECVGSGTGGPSITYNWTGVPLFYLLSAAGIVPGTYRKVVFNATDGYSSSVPLETAMEPNSILAFEANGTDLENLTGIGSGHRVVFPCLWGYKWVKWVKQIIIVDYDYKGTYESLGYSDEAIRPDSAMPPTVPQLQTFNITDTGNYTVKALSKWPIESFGHTDTQLSFGTAGLEEDHGYFFVTFETELLPTPYRIYANQMLVNYLEIDYGNQIYLYFTYSNSTRTITIQGTSVTPVPLPGDVNGDEKVDMMDISRIADAFLSSPDHSSWNPNADLNNDSSVDMADISIGIDYFLESSSHQNERLGPH